MIPIIQISNFESTFWKIIYDLPAGSLRRKFWYAIQNTVFQNSFLKAVWITSPVKIVHKKPWKVRKWSHNRRENSAREGSVRWDSWVPFLAHVFSHWETNDGIPKRAREWTSKRGQQPLKMMVFLGQLEIEGGQFKTTGSSLRAQNLKL